MIELLFISKVRIKILRIYLEDPETEHHVRELVRLTDEEINAVRRELKNLEKAGILVSKPKLNKIIFKLNPYCAIVNELKLIFYKDSPFNNSIVQMAKEIGSIELALLTNNFLTGKYINQTDVDLLFVGSPDINALNSKMTEIERQYQKQIRYTIISKDDFEFRKKKRDPFLINILHNDKILLVGSEKDLIL